MKSSLALGIQKTRNLNFENAVQYHYDQLPPKKLKYDTFVNELLGATDAFLGKATYLPQAVTSIYEKVNS